MSSADNNGAQNEGGHKKKSLILNAFVEMCKFIHTKQHEIIKDGKKQGLKETPGSGHQSPGLWRHPDDQSHRFNDLEYWTSLAQTLEKAKFHGIFIADVLGTYALQTPNHGPHVDSHWQKGVTMSTRARRIWILPPSQAHSGPSMNLWL